MTDQPIVAVPMRVRYHECDQQGVVFNAHYLTYADIAATEAARELFGSWKKLVEHGVDLVVAESTLRYLRPCRDDDEITVGVFTQRVGTTSLVLRFDVRNDGELATEITTRYVWVDPKIMRPTAPSTAARDPWARHLVAQPGQDAAADTGAHS